MSKFNKQLAHALKRYVDQCMSAGTNQNKHMVYVPFDPAKHGEGMPVQGCGTCEDPIQVPVKSECKPVGKPAIVLLKTCYPEGPHDLGDTITYRFQIENCGNVPLEKVVLSDDMVELQDISYNLEPGQFVVQEATYTISADHCEQQKLTNIAHVRGETESGECVTSTSAHSCAVNPLPTPKIKLEIIKPDPSTTIPVYVEGSVVPVVYRITNCGLLTLTDINVVPEGALTTTGSPLTLTPGGFDESWVGEHVVTAAEAASGSINCRADVFGTTPNDLICVANANTILQLVPPNPSLTIDKDCEITTGSGLLVGDEVTYYITIVNTGNTDLTGITLKDAALNLVDFPVADIGVNQTNVVEVVLPLTQADLDEGELTCTTTICASGGGIVIEQDSAVHQLALPPRLPSMDVSKVCALDSGTGEIEYTITVTNTGNIPLTGVSINGPGIGIDNVATTPADVPVDGTSTLTHRYTPTNAEIVAGMVVCSVDGNSNETPGPTASPDVGCAMNASMMIEKTCMTDAASGCIDFTITITNDGDYPLTGIELDADEIGINDMVLGDLAVGATAAPVIQRYCPTPAEAALGEYTCVASATAVEIPTPVDSNASTCDTIVPAPMMMIDKQCTLDTASGCIDYVITVMNNGNTDLTGIELNAAAVGLNAVAVPDLAEGETSAPINHRYCPTPAENAVGDFTCITEGTAAEISGTVMSNASTCNTVVPAPMMMIEKTCTLDAASGCIDYVITVTNNGNVDLTGIELNAAAVGLNAQAVPDLAVGDTSAPVNHRYCPTPAENALGSFTCTTDGTATEIPGTVQSNASTCNTIVPAPAIAITKSCNPGPHQPGDVVAYTFEVTNTGNEDLTGVTISDSIGAVSGGPIDLAAGDTDTSTFTMNYTVLAGDIPSLTNTATVAAVGAVTATDVMDDDEHTINVSATPVPCISVVKTCNPPGPFEPGETVNFQFEVSNCGNVDLDNVSIAIDVGTMSGGPISLAAGATDTATFTATYDIPAGAADGNQTCSSTVTADPADGSAQVSSTDDHTFMVMTVITCDDANVAANITLPAFAITDEYDEPHGVTVELLSCGKLGNGIFGGPGEGTLDTVRDNGNVINIPVPPHRDDCVLFLHMVGGQNVFTGLPQLNGAAGGSDLAMTEQFLLHSTNGGGNIGAGSAIDSDIWTVMYMGDGTGTAAGTIDVELPNLDQVTPSDTVVWVWAQACVDRCGPLRTIHVNPSPIYQAAAALIPDDGNAFNISNNNGPFVAGCDAMMFTAGRHTGGYSPRYDVESWDGDQPGVTVDFSAFPQITINGAAGHPFVVGQFLDTVNGQGRIVEASGLEVIAVTADSFTIATAPPATDKFFVPSGKYPLQENAGGCIASDWSGIDGKMTDYSNEVYDFISSVGQSDAACQAGIGLHHVGAGTHDWWYEENVPTAVQSGWSVPAMASVMEFDLCDVPAPFKTNAVTASTSTNFCTLPGSVSCTVTVQVTHDIAPGEEVVIHPEFDGTEDATQAVTLTGTGTTPVTFNSAAVAVAANGNVSCGLRLCVQPAVCSSFSWPDAQVNLVAMSG